MLLIPHLRSCESLGISDSDTKRLGLIGPVVSQWLPNLRSVTFSVISGTVLPDEAGFGGAVVVAASTSITKVVLNGASEHKRFSLQDEVNYACLLKRVFNTNLIGFEPTALWTCVVCKVPDGPTRAGLLYVKARLIVSSMH